MKKIWLYFRLNILYMFRNRARFILTVLGITIGLLIYVIGNVGVEAYMNSLYKEAYNFEKDCAIVLDDENQIIDRVQSLSNELGIHKCNFVGESYSLNNEYIYKGVKINNAMSLIGIDNKMLNSVVPYISNNNILLTKVEIVYGTDFSDEDIDTGKNYIIIEKSTAKYLFQKENAVGEYVDVISPYGYDRFMIIGIIEDLPVTNVKNLIFNRTLREEKETEYYNCMTAYTSYSYLNDMVGEENLQKRYIIDFGNVSDEEIFNKINRLNEECTTYNIDAKIVSQNTMLEEVRILENQISGFINVLIVIMMCISGFMIITIYIFSIKERTYEIGVRRALGASGYDIINQFIIEGIVTAVIAGLITLVIAVVSCNFGTAYFVGSLYMDIKFIMSKEIIFSMFGLSILQGITFCFLPSLIASKIRPTEAIRWD